MRWWWRARWVLTTHFFIIPFPASHTWHWCRRLFWHTKAALFLEKKFSGVWQKEARLCTSGTCSRSEACCITNFEMYVSRDIHKCELTHTVVAVLLARIWVCSVFSVSMFWSRSQCLRAVESWVLVTHKHEDHGTGKWATRSAFLLFETLSSWLLLPQCCCAVLIVPLCKLKPEFSTRASNKAFSFAHSRLLLAADCRASVNRHTQAPSVLRNNTIIVPA